VIICAAAAVLEGALAPGARQRLAQLRMPPYSPPFALWLVIGFLFYAMCLVSLRQVLSTGLVSASQVLALVLTVAVLLANAFWSLLFFRWRNLRASFIAFVPYAVLVAALVIVFVRTYSLGGILLSFYCIYLIYATRWGYHLWRLNTPKRLTNRCPPSLKLRRGRQRTAKVFARHDEQAERARWPRAKHS
jgi:benzodiazapine receptor